MSSAIGWEDALNINSSMSVGRNKIEFSDLFLRPKAPDKKTDEPNRYRFRILQKPHPYVIHWQNKNDEDNNRIEVPFPDAEWSRKSSRNCHKSIVRDKSGRLVLDKETDCPWCKMGYTAQLKYMLNVYDRVTKSVRILDVTSKIIDDIGKEIRVKKQEEDIIIRPENWEEPSPDFVIISSRSQDKSNNRFGGGGGVEHKVSVLSKMQSIDQEIIDAIASFNPKAKEECEDIMDYRRFLHPLERWVAPDEVQTAESAEERKNARAPKVEEEKDDDADELMNRAAAKPAAKPAVKAPKVKVEVEEEDDNFSEDAEW